MFRVKRIDKIRFGVKPDRRTGCYVRGGLLSFDIRMLPALLIRDRAGSLGAVLFNDAGLSGAARHAREQLDEALARFERVGHEGAKLECTLVGGNKERGWQLDAWRDVLRESGMKASEHETGGSYYRQIFFDAREGVVEVFQETASAEQGNPGKATLSLNDSTQVFRGTDAQGVVANATRFFREAKTFHGLKELVVPEHIELRPGQPFRLWSACCSNGVEAYSYAMFLHRLFQRLGSPVPLGVVGTDINDALIETAKAGVYKVSEAERAKFKHYFDAYARTQGDMVSFGPEIKRFLTFRPHDIKKPPRKHKFHAIICANVFQYYKDDARLHFLRNFASALETPGYLFVGPMRDEMAAEVGLSVMRRYGFLYKSE